MNLASVAMMALVAESHGHLVRNTAQTQRKGATQRNEERKGLNLCVLRSLALCSLLTPTFPSIIPLFQYSSIPLLPGPTQHPQFVVDRDPLSAYLPTLAWAVLTSWMNSLR